MRTRLVLSVTFSSVLAACGARVSLGELSPSTTRDGTDDRFSDDASGPSDASFDDVAFIHEVDAGDSEDAGDEDAGWSPCGGKVCGASCRLCPPGDGNCFETAELKACASNGKCLSAPVVCSDAGSP